MEKIKKFEQLAGEEQPTRYMFFSNLKTIKNAVDSLLAYDEQQINSMLQEHDWAVDHIATSADDIEEVYNFFKSHMSTNSPDAE